MESINKAKIERYVFLVGPNAPANVPINSDEEAAFYLADPDAFAARHFGLSAEDYLEWVRLEGRPLCGAKTAKGTPCSHGLGHGQGLSASEWKRRHRIELCAQHSDGD